jgi:hypothetical protein
MSRKNAKLYATLLSEDVVFLEKYLDDGDKLLSSRFMKQIIREIEAYLATYKFSKYASTIWKYDKTIRSATTSCPEGRPLSTEISLIYVHHRLRPSLHFGDMNRMYSFTIFPSRTALVNFTFLKRVPYGMPLTYSRCVLIRDYLRNGLKFENSWTFCYLPTIKP